MALPWLIGAAALAAGAALVKSLSEDDDNSSYDYEEASRRSEEAERTRAENERKKQLESARENFAIRGERIGEDIAQSLKGWIRVKTANSPTFKAQLNSRGYKIESAILHDQDIETLLPGKSHQFRKIREHLAIYSDLYSVRLTKGTKMVTAADEIETIDFELKQLETLKSEITSLKNELSTQV